MASSNRLARSLLLVLRVALGAVFLYAAWTKLREPWPIFAMAIDAYGVLPERAVMVVARTLPWAELAIGLLLIAGLWRRVATPAASLVLLLFFGLMVRAYAQGKQIDCGCFGLGEAISWRTLLRDGSLLAVSLLLTLVSLRGGRNNA